ncbi:MAG TPA: SdrD B-like domain-containing protein [Candidatus Krumholzibacteria bacterium]|nr:SdrD B-like domain-containing protein [Candidatus Krumholzibacteria bacterium]
MRFRRGLSLAVASTALLLSLALAGCSQTDPLTTPAPAGPAEKADAVTPIGNFTVTYLGRTFDGQQTTFRWNVAGTGADPNLIWWMVELPACAPEPSAWDPAEGGQFHDAPAYGFSGFKWELPIDAQDTAGRDYALTFPGDVAEGEVQSLATTYAGGFTAVIPGPCAGAVAGMFTLAGSVFTDADGDGLRGPGEGGIPGVAVDVVAAGGQVVTALTAGDGSWSASVPAGAYTVLVDTDAHADAFNPTLGSLFLPTTATSLDVGVGPDASGLDFGFTPDTAQILDGLDQGELQPAGETLRWWKDQLHHAIRSCEDGDEPSDHGRGYGRQGRFYSPARLLEFIAAIEQLALPEPYQFTDGDELREAYQTLRRHPRTDVEDLYRELLVTELNHVSGHALAGADPAFVGVLIAWGETLIVQEGADGAAKAGDNLLSAVLIFRSLNTGGGGGIDE